MKRTYTTRELAEIAAGLQGLLDAFPAVSTPLDRAIRARVEGAALALRLLAEGRSPTAADFSAPRT